MAEHKVTYRLSADGGQQVKAEFEGIGLAGQQSYDRIRKSTSEAEKSAQVFERALKAEKQSFDQLRASVDPAHAAMRRLEQVRAQANRAVFQGVATQKQANQVIAQAELQMRRYSATMEAADTVNVRSGRGLQNIAMQLNQVGQQGMATGNYLQAVAIQLPDMLAGFGGLAPAIIGAGLALSVAFIPALISGQDEAKKLEIDIQGAYGAAESAVGAAQQAQERYTKAIALSGSAQRTVTAEVLASLRAEAVAREALARLEELQLERQRRLLETTLMQQRAELERLVSEANSAIHSDPNDAFVRSAADEARLRAVEQVLDANREMVDQIARQQAELDLVNALLSQGHGEAARVVDELIKAADETRKAADEADRFATTISVTDLSAIGSQAAFLAQQMGIAADRAAVYNAVLNRQAGIKLPPAQGRFSFGLDGTDAGDLGVGGSNIGFGNVGLNMPPPVDVAGRLPSLSTRSGGGGGRRGGGGGASAADTAAQKAHNEALREAERIYKATRTEAEKYNEAVAKADELLTKGLISQETYDRHLQDLQKSMKGVSDGTREWEQLVTSSEDVIINAAMGQADAFEQLRQAIKRAAIEYALFGKGPLSGLFGGGGFGGALGWASKLLKGLPSFDGGGTTPNLPRTGGLDGKGGFLAMLHPQEEVRDKTRNRYSGDSGNDMVPVFGIGDGVQVNWLQRAQFNAMHLTAASARGQRDNLPAAVSDMQLRGA